MTRVLMRRSGGGRHREEWSFYEFRNFIQENGMIDIGFEGTHGFGIISDKMEKSSKDWIEDYVVEGRITCLNILSALI